MRQLKRLARHVGHIISGFPAGDPSTVPTISDMLRKYAEALVPWAEVTARRMIEEVDRRNVAHWKKISGEMSAHLRREILTAPTGETMHKLMDEQVNLIKSIPLDAARRVHKLTIEGLENSTRFPEIAKEIMNSAHVAESRAVLIARTETARTQANLTQARAQHAGSEGYIWRTSGDGAVRHDHKILNGKYFRWDDPPIADRRSGARAHPGAIYNCRCWAEVIVPE